MAAASPAPKLVRKLPRKWQQVTSQGNRAVSLFFLLALQVWRQTGRDTLRRAWLPPRYYQPVPNSRLVLGNKPRIKASALMTIEGIRISSVCSNGKSLAMRVMTSKIR